MKNRIFRVALGVILLWSVGDFAYRAGFSAGQRSQFSQQTPQNYPIANRESPFLLNPVRIPACGEMTYEAGRNGEGHWRYPTPEEEQNVFVTRQDNVYHRPECHYAVTAFRRIHLHSAKDEKLKPCQECFARKSFSKIELADPTIPKTR